MIGEALNLILIYFTFFLYPNYGVIWSQMSGYILYYYQAYLCLTTRSCFLLSLKQSVLWLGVGLYFQKIDINDFSCFVAGFFSLLALQVTSMYFEHLKETEICKSKYRVRELNKKMTEILETIQDLIIVLSTDRKELFSNSALRVFLAKQDLFQVLSTFEYSKQYSNQLPAHKTLAEGIDLALALPVGSAVQFGVVYKQTVYLEWSSKVINWDGCAVLMLCGRDVSKIIELEKENNENNYKSALISTVSHELRTPTNAIMTIGSIIQASGELTKNTSQQMDLLLGSCNYQLCLINDLLDYAQIVAGCLKITKTCFNFEALLSECASFIQLQMGNQIQLLKIIENVPENIITDPNRLKQILLNLLTNARKFTLRGCITLSLKYEKPKLLISCKDTGIGIPEEKLSSLFRAFSKIENSSEINTQGVGLGLVISSMLVQKLGGDGIKVKSKVGVGSTFEFFVLVDEAETCFADIANENPKVQIPLMLVKNINSKVRILIVDDVYFNIMAYVEIFKTEGIRCSYAMNGEEAIEKVLEFDRFSCILMDCEMPILDGWETTKRLISLQTKKVIEKLPPIIGASAHSEDDQKSRCLQAGMKDFITKPCPREILFHKVKFWILAN
jgi:signal transduction histidine kinase/CheY-like chemotaxis protein